jgi:hypothetical protein
MAYMLKIEHKTLLKDVSILYLESNTYLELS